MPFKKKRAPHIPPGAPGHPKTGAEARPARGQQAERRPRDESPRAPRQAAGARSPAAARAARGSARLVYEDDAILGYDKPVGLSVIAPEGSRARCLLDIASEQVARHKSRGRAAVVHRIDRDTSGIVIFAVDGRTKKLLMDGWDELVARRLYIALVEGRMPEGDGVFDSWLKENKAGEVFTAEPKDKGAKRAITRWRVLKQGPSLSLLELALETGRKHQIRVQLADSGHPVVGDERYGAARTGGTGRDIDLGRLCLHARLIELRLPGRDPLVVESASPPEFDAAIAEDIAAAAKAAAAAAKTPAARRAGASPAARRAAGARPAAGARRAGHKKDGRPRP